MKKINALCKWILMACGISLIICCSTKNTHDFPSDRFATFHYLEYKGYDPIYETLEPDENEYLNPILAGFYPDPSIEKVGNDYYLVNSTFCWFPGIPVFHSTDLVNWTQIGHVLNRPEQANFDSLGMSRGVFAPAIAYHEGTFYVVCTLVDCGGNFVVTAKDPAGPWSDPKFLSFEGIDPSLFFDDDGKAYIVNNGAPVGPPLYEGHRAIWIQEFDPEKLEMTGSRKVLINGGVDITAKPVWIEGPHIYKINDFYYLSAAEGGTSVNHSQVIFRSRDIRGPFVPWENNPMLTQRQLDINRPNPVTSTGHLDLVKTQNDEWWAVFLACTPYVEDFYNTGRQTFLLPLHWTEDGWPFVLTGDQTVPYMETRPELPHGTPSPIPLNGNFTFRDEFSDSSLALIYNFVRTPREKWYSLQDSNLYIEARNEAIDGLGQPSFIGRRQQHQFCSVITSLVFNPEAEAAKAGMAVYQNRAFYYFIGITRTEGQRAVIVEKGSAEGARRLITIPVDQTADEPLYLKIDSRGAFYDFFFATEADVWQSAMEDVDAIYLSTHVAGGFTGAYFGLYAYHP